MSSDLLDLADELVPTGRTKPKQVKLRRALSCAYYAMFHSLAKVCADTLIGSGKADRTERAWRQVYRSLRHGDAGARCEKVVKRNNDLGFPVEIITFARQFKPAMNERHAADYDPGFEPRKGTVLASILAAEIAIRGLERAELRHRRAFAAFILFQQRS